MTVVEDEHAGHRDSAKTIERGDVRDAGAA